MVDGPQPNEHDKSRDAQATEGDDLPSGVTERDVAGIPGKEISRTELEKRYEFQGVLGKGGMGEVLRAIDTRLKRPVAIKRVRGEIAQDKNILERFLIEAQAIAALNHPNIVRVYDYGTDDEGPFIVMELVEGESLQERLQVSPLKVDEGIELACQLCNGLAVAHEQGIVHRDIKPGNILLARSGEAKLMDFGLVQQFWTPQKTAADIVLGTIVFMSPEQRCNATVVDARSDLWSLAATLYQMVTGKSPKIIMLSEVPSALQNVLSKALEEDPVDRYQTAREMCNALQACLSDDRVGQVELENGQCPACETQNELSRKYCRNCGASLTVACLSCTAEILMWEEICGDCGANQQVLAEEYREGLRSQQEKAEERRKQGDLKAARIIAAIVRDEPDARFQHLAGWARQFLVSLDEEYDQMFKELPGYLERALHYETESDYREAIETLQQIPAWLRNEPLPGHPVTASELLTQLTAKQAEIKRLEKLIMERVQTRELTGLMLEVESILALHPGHPDMLNVKQQLVHWEGKRRESRDQFYSQAQQYFADHDYERCLGELAMIETSLVNSEVEDLRDRTEAACDRLERLDKMISSAIQEKVFSGLLKPVEEYLELKPGSAGMEKLHQTLVEREKENAARVSEILKVAENLRKECRFDEAASLLQDQPPELEMPELISLRKDSLSVSDTRTVALDAIQNAMQTGNFSSGLADAEQYYELQEVRSFRDAFFLAQHKACSEALEQDQELRAVVARRWAKARKIILIASSLLAMGVLVIVSMRISSAVRQAMISELIENQHWDEVLVLDADHVQALIGRARDGLASGTADIEEVFTDLERAERLDPEAVGMLEVKGLAHLERASLRAQRDQVDAAEIDWRVAEVLKTDEVHQLPVRQALVEAYLRRAELSLEKGEANAVSADCGRAEELGSRASDLVGLRLEAYQLRAERLVAVGDMEAAQATLEAALALGKRQPRLMQAIEALHIALGQKALANNDLVVARRELMVALEISRPETGSSSPEKSTTSRELLAFEGHASQVWDLAFSPDGKQIATASEDQMVKVWNATRGRRLLVFEGHTGTVWSIAFSPDGQQLISGGGTDKKAGEIKLWDLATGKLLFTKQEHALAVQGVAFRSDGKQVASASWDSTIQLWDVASGEKQHTLIGHSGVVQGVAFSPDGKRIASASGDRTVRVWDDSNGELLRTLNGHDLRVSSVVFSPDGIHLASASADKTIRLWEATTGKQLQELTGHTDAVSHVAFSPDGKRLASASTDKTIRLWDTATGKRLLTIGPGSREFQRVSFGPTGKRLASASHDGKIQVWDISDLLVTDNHRSKLVELAVAIAEPAIVALEKDAIDANRIAALAALKEVAVVDVESKALMDLRSRVLAVVGRPIAAYEKNVTAVHRKNALSALKEVSAIDSEGRIYAALKSRVMAVISRPVVVFEKDLTDVNRDAALSAIKSLEILDNNMLQVLALNRRVANSLLQRAAMRVASNAMDEVIADLEQAMGLANSASLEAAAKKTVVNGLRIHCLALLNQKQVEKAAGYYVIVSRLDVGARKELTIEFMKIPVPLLEKISPAVLEQFPSSVLARFQPLTLKSHTGPVYNVSFSADGKRLASAGESFGHYGEVRLWDVFTGKRLLSNRYGAPVRSIAFSQDGKRLASAGGMGSNNLGRSRSGDVRIWNATTNELLVTLQGLNTPIMSVVFNPDGQTLATAGDRKVKVWDVATGKLLRTLDGHADEVWAVAYSPDGKLLASSGMGQEIRLWEVSTGENIRTLDGHVTRVFSLSFSPDGKQLASAGYDKLLKLWDVSTGKESMTLKGHDGFVRAVSFSPDGKRLASASADRTVKVWNISTGKELVTLKGHTGIVSSVAFSPDGKRLASGSTDKTVRVWFVPGF